jgi:hypothetical protein
MPACSVRIPWARVVAPAQKRRLLEHREPARPRSAACRTEPDRSWLLHNEEPSSSRHAVQHKDKRHLSGGSRRASMPGDDWGANTRPTFEKCWGAQHPSPTFSVYYRKRLLMHRQIRPHPVFNRQLGRLHQRRVLRTLALGAVIRELHNRPRPIRQPTRQIESAAVGCSPHRRCPEAPRSIRAGFQALLAAASRR